MTMMSAAVIVNAIALHPHAALLAFPDDDDEDSNEKTRKQPNKQHALRVAHTSNKATLPLNPISPKPGGWRSMTMAMPDRYSTGTNSCGGFWFGLRA